MKGSVHQDKRVKKWFISIYWEGKRYRIFRHPVTGEPFLSEKSARKQLSRIQTEVDDGTFNPKAWMPDSPLSMRLYCQEWLKNVDVTKKTLIGYKTAVENYIVPFFKDKDIRHIRYNDIANFKRSIPLSSKSVYNTVSVLKTILRYAWRNEDIQRVPPFPKLSFDLPEIDYLTMEQQEEQLKAIPERHRPIFMFMMEYGLRIQEARALKKDCIKDGMVSIKRVFSENELRETTKTGHKGVRAFALTEYAQEVLESIEPHLSPFVFVREDGKPYTNKNLNAIWQHASKETGINCKLYNSVRHSAGCHLVEQGEDIDLVREFLGHTKSEMTRRYAKRRPARITEALEKRRKVVLLPEAKKSDKTK